jgi:SAM-dependent methyltransferase
MGDYHSMIQVRIRELVRRTIRYLGGLSNRDAEYDFAYRQVVGERVSVLDVGGSESLLPLQLAKRGYSVTVYDFREYPEQHPNLSTIQGDFLANKIPDNSFDFVVMISTIEHIGFGSYGAPVYADGDFMAMSQAKRILKPSGRIVLTFPFASKEHIVTEFERWYDITRVQRLIEGMYVLAEEYYVPHTKVLGRVVKWLPASLEQIANTDDVVQRYGYQCNACYVVSPIPRSHFINPLPKAG